MKKVTKKKKLKGASKKVSIKPYDELLIKCLKSDPGLQHEFLKEALEESDHNPMIFIRAAAAVATARGLTQFSKDVGLNRENLYRIFSGERSPTLESYLKIANALGFRLTLVPAKPA